MKGSRKGPLQGGRLGYVSWCYLVDYHNKNTVFSENSKKAVAGEDGIKSCHGESEKIEPAFQEDMAVQLISQDRNNIH